MGSSRGPRTWPTLQRMSPASSNRGKRVTALLDRDLQLEPGEVRSEATVDAEPEGCMPVHGAVDDECVRVLELVRIAVGCGERKQHEVVLLHRIAEEVDVLGDQASHGDRCVRAEELLERELS